MMLTKKQEHVLIGVLQDAEYLRDICEARLADHRIYLPAADQEFSDKLRDAMVQNAVAMKMLLESGEFLIDEESVVRLAERGVAALKRAGG